MRILPMGHTAVLIEDPPGDPASWSIGFRMLDVPGVIDVVPAARTVLIRCESREALVATTARFDSVEPMRPTVGDDVGSLVVIPVSYDGPDLIEVAGLVGCTVDEVVALHSSPTYDVAFCGFAPGFGYLRGLAPELHLPRRSTPRIRVPAGSVAIASEFTAVYPTESPGGWHLLGTTDVPMFDARREPPALLAPGTSVRFEAR